VNTATATVSAAAFASGPPLDAPRSRDRNRGERILQAAAEQFALRGYHAVSIDDIGTAAGITGPGIYRHFAGKEEILVAVLDRAAAAMWAMSPVAPTATTGMAIVGGVASDAVRPTIDDYVVAHIAWAVHHVDEVTLWHQERRHLPEADFRRQRRMQRTYLARWVDALIEERPEIDEAIAWVMVRAVVGMIHSIGHYDNMADRLRLRDVVAAMSLHALRSPRPQLEHPES
jgi:AcrR family transcriptional regulator